MGVPPPSLSLSFLTWFLTSLLSWFSSFFACGSSPLHFFAMVHSSLFLSSLSLFVFVPFFVVVRHPSLSLSVVSLFSRRRNSSTTTESHHHHERVRGECSHQHREGEEEPHNATKRSGRKRIPFVTYVCCVSSLLLVFIVVVLSLSIFFVVVRGRWGSISGIREPPHKKKRISHGIEHNLSNRLLRARHRLPSPCWWLAPVAPQSAPLARLLSCLL